MIDDIWPDNISREQAADTIDDYVKLVGEDHFSEYRKRVKLRKKS
jgi:hypothetical protein